MRKNLNLAIVSLLLAVLASGCSMRQSAESFVNFVRTRGDAVVNFVDNHGNDIVDLAEEFDADVMEIDPSDPESMGLPAPIVITDLSQAPDEAITACLAPELPEVVAVVGLPYDCASIRSLVNGEPEPTEPPDYVGPIEIEHDLLDEIVADFVGPMVGLTGDELLDTLDDGNTLYDIVTFTGLTVEEYNIQLSMALDAAGLEQDLKTLLYDRWSLETEPDTMACAWTVNPDQEPAPLDSLELRADGSTWICSNDRTWVLYIPAPADEPEPADTGSTVTAVEMTPVDTWMVGDWEVEEFDLSNDPIVLGWIQRLRNPAPEVWQTFPNIPNELVPDFRVISCEVDATKDCVPDGMEYGTYSTPYCWASPCDIPVGAWEYRYISGDYQFLNRHCKGENGNGCMLVLVNVMDASYTWRDQYVDNGFTLRGRYFNGDALEWGLWGLVSHGAANMLNMPTMAHPGEVLNSGQPGNSGANCGSPAACVSVDVTIVVHAGDRILAILHTVVNKPAE